MTAKAVARLTWPLTPASAATLTVANIQAMTLAQAATLTASTLNAMSASAIAALSAAQIRAISADAIGGLTSAQTLHLSPSALGALTAAETARLATSALAGFSSAQVAALNGAGLLASQVAALSASQTAALGVAEIDSMTASALGALKTGSLTTTQVAGLTATQIAALSTAQIDQLSTADVAALSPNAAKALSAATLASLTSAQAGALTAAALNAMSSTQLQALHLPALGVATLAGLNAAALAGLSAAEFAAAVGSNVAALSTGAIAGLTVAEIDALSPAQLQGFTAAQRAAMSAPVAAEYSALTVSSGGGNALLSAFAAQVSNGAIGYNGLLTVLQGAAVGGMTSDKLAALVQIAHSLNASGGPTTSVYAQQMFNDVVLGNSANATWTGGASSSTALGNLTATSSQTQVTELIGKWFLGTDLPSWQSEGGAYGQGYQTYNEALFAGGAPSYNDINQGQLGDCYFLSALATEAEQNPLLIENMIQSNGNGTYSVLFHVNGQNDYVTVNSQLVALKSGYIQPDGSSMLYDSNTSAMWAPLIEKAYAELNAQSGVLNYGGVGNIDSYRTIGEGGDANGLQAITGQQVIEDYVGSGVSGVTTQAYLNAVQTAFNSGQGVMLATSNTSSGNFVGDHMYSVVGVDATAGTVLLHNPWGAAECSSAGIQATFTATLSQLTQENVWLEYTTGARATA